MSETNADYRSDLNDLIQTCKDGQQGFLTASQNIEDADIKHLFNEYSLQRAKFAGELQSAAHSILGNSNPEETGSLAGALHRGWINLKTALEGKDRHDILAECERGEDVAVGQYKKILEHNLPAPLRDLAAQQSAEVQKAHDRVKALRDSSASK